MPPAARSPQQGLRRRASAIARLISRPPLVWSFASGKNFGIQAWTLSGASIVITNFTIGFPVVPANTAAIEFHTRRSLIILLE